MATRIRMPDVHVHEIATGPVPIAAVPTSIAAFIGRTRTGPVDRPLMIRSFPDFERDYGGLSADSPLSDAVQQFFANGGREAVIVRISHGTDEGALITADDLIGPSLQAAGRGLWLLDAVDHCNLLCIPPLSRTVDVPTAVWNAAVAYCQQRRILLIVDPPAGWTSPEQAVAGVDALLTRSSAAVLCFPNLRVADSLNGGQATRCAPCGMVAGVIARTDSTRGVWKAPAGVEAVLKGELRNAYSLSRPPGHHATPGQAMGGAALDAVSAAVQAWPEAQRERACFPGLLKRSPPEVRRIYRLCRKWFAGKTWRAPEQGINLALL